MDDKEQFALTLKALREASGLTQRELAEETKISLSAIVAYENKQREPNSRNMAILERFFHVSGDDLRGGILLHQHDAVNHREDLPLLSSLMRDILAVTKVKSEHSQLQIEQILMQLLKILRMEDEAMMNVLLDMADMEFRNLRQGMEKALEIQKTNHHNP